MKAIVTRIVETIGDAVLSLVGCTLIVLPRDHSAVAATNHESAVVVREDGAVEAMMSDALSESGRRTSFIARLIVDLFTPANDDLLEKLINRRAEANRADNPA